MNGFGDVPAYILAIAEVCTNPSCWTPTSTSSCGTLLVARESRKPLIKNPGSQKFSSSVT